MDESLRVAYERTIERERVGDLVGLVPAATRTVLDIGARGGFIARQLADRGFAVTALDLERPLIDDPRIECVQGDATRLAYGDRSFDLVFCAEVLEHIAQPALERAACELARVARRHLVIGVPYRQDLRLWRTRCGSCGAVNPPWGHVNSFDEAGLLALFAGWRLCARRFIGIGEPGTNALSVWLMDLAGNPYGTYVQDESCIRCGAALLRPGSRTSWQRVCTRAAVLARAATARFEAPRPNWIHLLLERAEAG